MFILNYNTFTAFKFLIIPICYIVFWFEWGCSIYSIFFKLDWLRYKNFIGSFIEVSLEVVDLEEGTGRNAGRLGAIICEGEEDGRRIRVNVGSGFSDSDRDSFWKASNQLFGNVVEVRADAVTQNQDGTYSLRFPRFLRFRGFEPGEKI